jgi:hypothetical protein
MTSADYPVTVISTGVRWWAFSPLDQHWHVVDVDDRRDLRAVCGRFLSTETRLHEAFNGQWCQRCAESQLIAVPALRFGRDQLFPSRGAAPTFPPCGGPAGF